MGQAEFMRAPCRRFHCSSGEQHLRTGDTEVRKLSQCCRVDFVPLGQSMRKFFALRFVFVCCCIQTRRYLRLASSVDSVLSNTSPLSPVHRTRNFQPCPPKPTLSVRLYASLEPETFLICRVRLEKQTLQPCPDGGLCSHL